MIDELTGLVIKYIKEKGYEPYWRKSQITNKKN
jgi:hypothetical protein